MARKKKIAVEQSEPVAQNGEKDYQWDALFNSLGGIELVMIVGAILLLLLLIYTIQNILSPFLILGAILFLLFPLRGYSIVKKIMWLSVILFAIWFVVTISSLLAPFVFAMVLAYVMNPIVDKTETWGVPRWVSALILILLLIGIITLILFLVLPVALSQFQGILDSLSKLFSDFNNWLLNGEAVKVLQKYGISSQELRKTLETSFAPKLENILKNLFESIITLISSVGGLVTQIFYVVLVPFLTFYILADFPKIIHFILNLIPHIYRDRVSEYARLGDQVIGLYLRGILTIAFLQGILVFVAFSLVGIKYSLMLGVLAAALDLVPYFGLIITMVVSIVVASMSDTHTLEKVLFVMLWVEGLRLAETMYLSPKIVGTKVGMHPLLIIFSILVFYFFLGFLGLLIAVPTTALIILLVREWEANKRGIPLSKYHSQS
ncbi:MAG: AI-2E family transporter [bacterium]